MCFSSPMVASSFAACSQFMSIRFGSMFGVILDKGDSPDGGLEAWCFFCGGLGVGRKGSSPAARICCAVAPVTRASQLGLGGRCAARGGSVSPAYWTMSFYGRWFISRPWPRGPARLSNSA